MNRSIENPVMKTVGRFEYYEDGSIAGPKGYMEEKGSARVESMTDGTDITFNHALENSNDFVTAMLVTLQTDYAGWAGTNSFMAAHGYR